MAAGPKSASKPKAELIAGQKLSSPAKLLWPEAGVTKHDLACYYADFADRLLRFVDNRPLSLVRCPDGYVGECFFQKHHTPATPDAIDTVAIVEKDGSRADYLLIRNVAGLVGAAQIGGLELHVWGARADSLEKPERIVFDLDPDEGLPFASVTRAAMEVRDGLAALGLTSFPLLTGGKGVHVVAPVTRTQAWPNVKAFASGFARKLAADAPERYLAQASKAKREGRIFIDWLRNERGATAVAPYSPRARSNAPVATPVSWAELPKLTAASAFTLNNIRKRQCELRADPWEGYFTARQALKAGMIAAVA